MGCCCPGCGWAVTCGPGSCGTVPGGGYGCGATGCIVPVARGTNAPNALLYVGGTAVAAGGGVVAGFPANGRATLVASSLASPAWGCNAPPSRRTRPTPTEAGARPCVQRVAGPTLRSRRRFGEGIIKALRRQRSGRWRSLCGFLLRRHCQVVSRQFLLIDGSVLQIGRLSAFRRQVTRRRFRRFRREPQLFEIVGVLVVVPLPLHSAPPASATGKRGRTRPRLWPS